MAAPKQNIASLCQSIINDARSGVFKPVYLLMGEEPFYPEMVCKAIIDNCVDESFKDFNEIILYGGDVTAEQIISSARQYPMMSERLLVVVKEAQQCKDIDKLSIYCDDPLDSTVLVVLMSRASADKRKAFYKSAQKAGIVVDSPLIRDYEMAGWISNYYTDRGLKISPQAAALLAESVGTDISTLVVETDKMLRNLPQGTVSIEVADIEKNVGISRQYTVFELNKEISMRNAPKALKIAYHVGSAPKFAMPMAVSALYMHFNRILRYGALLESGKVDPDAKSRALSGVNPYFYREYDAAVRNFPVRKAMAAMSLLCEYDYLGKGGDGGSVTSDCDLLVELTSKLLNL